MDEKKREQVLGLEELTEQYRQAAQEGDARAQYELAAPTTSTMSIQNPSIGGKRLRKAD